MVATGHTLASAGLESDLKSTYLRDVASDSFSKHLPGTSRLTSSNEDHPHSWRTCTGQSVLHAIMGPIKRL